MSIQAKTLLETGVRTQAQSASLNSSSTVSSRLPNTLSRRFAPPVVAHVLLLLVSASSLMRPGAQQTADTCWIGRGAQGRAGRWSPAQTKPEQEVIALIASGQNSAADAARLFRVHPATVSRVLNQHRAEQLDKAPAPNPKLPVRKKKSVAKKDNSSVRIAWNNAETPVGTILDAFVLPER